METDTYFVLFVKAQQKILATTKNHADIVMEKGMLNAVHVAEAVMIPLINKRCLNGKRL